MLVTKQSNAAQVLQLLATCNYNHILIIKLPENLKQTSRIPNIPEVPDIAS